MITWTKKQARDFLVNYQMINTRESFTIKEVFHRIKTIQMDPLNVVGINPDLVLQARVDNYHQGDLNDALYKERYLIDGWEKQMSIYETKYFPHFSCVRKDRSERALKGAKKYLNIDATPYVDEVYDIVKSKGPIYSSQIKLGESKNSVWGHSKPSTIAIDYLWNKGLLGIQERNNTQKRYALIETLIPNHNEPSPFESEQAFIKWYLLRRIQTVGLTYSKSTVHFDGLHISKKAVRMKVIEELLDENAITEVLVEGIADSFYIPTSALDIKLSLQDKITFVAPLDNLTWDRVVLQKLFDFHYVWEVYTPAKKRTYGYYVLPILKGSNFIGKIEFEKQRNKDPLKVKTILYEDHVKQTKKLEQQMKSALTRFAEYLGTSEIVLPKE